MNQKTKMTRIEKIQFLKDVFTGKVKPAEAMPFKIIIWNKQGSIYEKDGQEFTESEFEIISHVQSLNEMHVVIIPPIDEND
jgi:hypothetical protein